MKAMILAAGYGKRMRPLTMTLPKALLPIGSKTLLDIVVEKLNHSGINQICINAYYLKEKLIAYIQQHYPEITVFTEPELLDSGGGIYNARHFFKGEKYFIVHNVDIVSDISIQELVHHLNAQNSLACLSVSARKSDRYLLFDEKGFLAGWKNTVTGETIFSRKVEHYIPLAFNGIHAISIEAFDLMKKESNVFSIIDFYLKYSAHYPVTMVEYHGNKWFDVGKYEQFDRIRQEIINLGLI